MKFSCNTVRNEKLFDFIKTTVMYNWLFPSHNFMKTYYNIFSLIFDWTLVWLFEKQYLWNVFIQGESSSGKRGTILSYLLKKKKYILVHKKFVKSYRLNDGWKLDFGSLTFRGKNPHIGLVGLSCCNIIWQHLLKLQSC